MLKPRVMAMGFVLGFATFSVACVATVDDSQVDELVGEEDEKSVEVTEEELGIARLPPRLPLRLVPRIFRLNLIDPGGRLLQCLPDPRKQYLARDPDVCAGIRFYCPEGIPFFDRCGCGCEVNLSE